MTILYTVATFDKEQQDYFVYIRTLDSAKANKLRDILIEEYPEVEIITSEIDNPVYYLELEYPDGHTQFNVISVMEPENDPELATVTIKRKERLI